MAQASIEERRNGNGNFPESLATLPRAIQTYIERPRIRTSALVRLNELLDGENADLCQVTATFTSDLGLAAQLVRASVEEKCDFRRIEDCIVLLGIDRLRRIVFDAEPLPDDASVVPVLDAISRHSRLTAASAESLAIRYGHPKPGHAYLAGLLHDVGKLPLAFAQMDDVSEGLTYGHCEAGLALAHVWRMPHFIRDVIENHHRPKATMEKPLLANVVNLADRLAHEAVDPLAVSQTDLLSVVGIDPGIPEDL